MGSNVSQSENPSVANEAARQLAMGTGVDKVAEALPGADNVARETRVAAVKQAASNIAAGTAALTVRAALKAAFPGLSEEIVELIVTTVEAVATLSTEELAKLMTEENTNAARDLIIRTVANFRKRKVVGSAYGGYAAKVKTGGGCGCVVGGVELKTVGKYSGSAAESVNAKLVNDILKFAEKSGSLSDGSVEEKIKSYTERLRKGTENGADKRCIELGKEINDTYGNKVIRTDAGAGDVCAQIAELLHSLNVGLQSEFLVVYADVQSTLQNLQFLKTALSANQDAAKTALKNADGVSREKLTTIVDINDELLVELERQIALLHGLTGATLVSSDKMLAEMVRKGDLSGAVAKLKQSSSGKNLAIFDNNLRRGLAFTATLANRVHEALKKVGLTIEQYRAADSVGKLKEAMLSGLLKAGDVAEQMAAASFLANTFENRDDVLARIEGGDDSVGAVGNALYGGPAYGGADFDIYDADDSGYALSDMERKKKAYEKMRDMIMTVFYRALNEKFNLFVVALNSLAARGRDMPATDALRDFLNLLSMVNTALIHNERIYYALIGYFSDALSMSLKDRFVGDLNALSAQLDAILALPEYAPTAQHFRDVKDAIAAILAVINKYSEEVAQKYGRVGGGKKTGGDMLAIHPSTDFSPSYTGGAYGGAYGGADDNVGEVDGGYPSTSFSTAFTDMSVGGTQTPEAAMLRDFGMSGIAGGNDEAVYGGALAGVTSISYRTPRTVTDAITSFKYQMRANIILKNMAATSGEFAEYTAKQSDINAQSIADLVRKREKEFILMREALEKLKDTEVIAQGTDIENDDAFSAAKKDAGEILDRQWKAMRGFWAALESMDSCLRNFTDSLVRNPSQVQEIEQLLDNLDVITEWYDDRTGNILAAIFEKFPKAISDGLNTDIGTDKNAAVGGPAHYYESIATHAAAAGNPYNVTTPVHGLTAIKGADKLFQSMNALKNLFSVFLHIGRTVGTSEERPMPPAVMYKHVVNFLVASSFSQGFNVRHDGDLIGSDDKGVGEWGTAITNGVNADIGGRGVAVGMEVQQAAAGTEKQVLFKKRYGLHMRSIQTTIQGADGFNFAVEDQYFSMMLKAAAAKVLTVTGTYNLFNRPSFAARSGIAPIRMILGGADEVPEVIPEAVELYLRLPLLVQWYRQLFGFDAEYTNADQYKELPFHDADHLRISLIPDLDGTFSKIIRLIFRDIRGVDTASYTDDDVKSIIREVNLIFQRQSAKHAQNVVRGTILDLVNEVNRRYGIVTKAARDSYESDFGRAYDYAESGKLDPYSGRMDTELALLPGEGEDSIPYLAPSERMLGATLPQIASRKSKYTVSTDYKKLLWKFRCSVDKMLASGGDNHSFDPAIAATKQELKSETRAQKRFELVASLMRGADLRSRVNGMKYVFFNETVVAGLNSLSGIHTLLSRFQQRAIMCDVEALRDSVIDYLQDAPANAAIDSDAMVDSVKDALVKKFNLLDLPANVEFLGNVFGKHEKKRATGAGNDWEIHDGAAQGLARIANLIGGAGKAETPFTGGTGLCALLNDLSAKRMRELLGRKCTSANDVADRKRIDAFFRGLFDRQFIMQEMLENLFALGQEKMINVSMSNSHLNVTYGGLEESIKNTFSSVFYFLNLLRPRVEKSLVEKYTTKTTQGSYYWLQEQLVEKILVGRDGRGTSTAYVNLAKVSRKLASTWAFLVGETSNIDKDVANNATVADGKSRTDYGRVFAKALFYNAELPNSGLMGSEDAADGAAGALLVDFQRGTYESLMAGGPPDKKVLDTRFAGRFKQLYTWNKEFTHNRSMLFSFNQLVAKFIQSFYDGNTSKIYLGLIDKFANGTFARAVSDHKFTYPDTIPAVQVKYTGAANVGISQVHRLSADVNAAQLAALTELIRNAVNGAGDTDVAARWLAPGSAGRRDTPVAAVPAITGLQASMVRAIRDMDNRWQRDGAGVLMLRPVGAPAGADIAAAANAANAYNAINAPRAADFRAILAVNPFSDNMIGNGGNDAKSRAEMLAAILLNYGSYGPFRGGGAATAKQNAIDAIRKILKNSAYNVPIPGAYGGPKTTVPGEDFITMDTSNPTTAAIVSGAAEKSTLVFARTDDISGVGKVHNFGDVDVTDDLRTQLAFGTRADPDSEHVLFTSLAVILRTLTTSKTASCPTCSVYAEDNVANLPVHMKEKMRANLPAFRRLFSELKERCEFFRAMMARGDLSLGRTVPRNTVKPWPYTLLDPSDASNENKNRFGGIAETIIRGCSTLIEACDRVLREVGDDVKFFETHEGSIRDYAAQNGVNPLMPLSNMLVVLKNESEDTYLNLFPVHELGENKFKLMYGTRGAFNPLVKATPEMMVGFTDVVNGYNALVDAQSSARDTTEYLAQFVRNLRFLHGARTRALLSSYHTDLYTDGVITDADLYTRGLFVRNDMVQIANTPITNKSEVSLQIDDAAPAKPVFAIAKELPDILRLTESADREDKIKEFVQYLHKGDDKPTDLATQNILDLDIVPINVHALSRELPFATTMNYAYTFERMAIELFYGHNSKNTQKIIDELCGCDGKTESGTIRSAKDALVALLIDPYRSIKTEDANHFEGMMLGRVAIEGLGTPKFLADQVYGKATFGEIYGGRNAYNELGPGAGSVVTAATARATETQLAAAIFSKIVYENGTGTANPMINVPRGTDDKDTIVLGDMIARYYYDNPTATVQQAVDAMKGLLKDKFDKHLTAGLRASDDEITKSAWTYAIIGRFTSAIAAIYSAGSRSGDATNATATYVSVLGALKNIDPAAAGKQYMGIAANAAAANAALKGISVVVNRVDVTARYKPIITRMANSIAVLGTTAPLTLFANGQWTDNGVTAIIDNAAAAQERATESVHGAPGFHTRNPAKLHYLAHGIADGNTDLDGAGATEQPDNANVLDSRQIREVAITGADAAYLADMSALRMDTVLVRNLIFITNLLRSLRLQLSNDLHYGEGSIVSANANVAPRLTEMFGNRVATVDRAANYYNN